MSLIELLKTSCKSSQQVTDVPYLQGNCKNLCIFLIDKFLRKPVHQNMDEELDRVVAVQEDDTSSDEDTSSENGM
jgi:hypothetical protein